MSINVSNPSADRDGKIDNAASIIGKSKDALEFFDAVYTKKNIIKTILDIRKMTSIKSDVRVLQVGKKFASNDIVEEIKDPKTKRLAWKKIDFYTHNKKAILSKVKKKNDGSKPDNYNLGSKLASKKVTRKNSSNKKWDVFMSHAFEDKIIAEPFSKKLKEEGLEVWYDKDILKWGDSLMDSINKGLKDSLYGIVILSKKFFKKQWTLRELRALLSLSNKTEESKILPLFYKISHDEITDQYPILADIVGRSWNEGPDVLAKEIKSLVDGKKSKT